jgi:hypothetical protein
VKFLGSFQPFILSSGQKFEARDIKIEVFDLSLQQLWNIIIAFARQQLFRVIKKKAS